MFDGVQVRLVFILIKNVFHYKSKYENAANSDAFDTIT